MSDSQHTRFITLRADSDRSAAHNSETRCVGTREFARVVLLDHRALFNHHQSRLRQIVAEHTRAGVVLFALHSERGLVGRLWLEASESLRAGTIGRHSRTDLFLPEDEELSLRHLLVLVKRSGAALRIRVADLATPGGFQAEEGGVLRAIDANGTVILRAASYSVLAIPTGAPAPWNSKAADPWLTLPARVLLSEERIARERPLRVRPASVETHVRSVEGLAEAGPEPSLGPGEAVEGVLLIGDGQGQRRLSVGRRALEQGIMLGRYPRCSGASAMSDRVSRVHAVLIAIEGEVHLVDAGSTNGTRVDDEEFKCGPVEHGRSYSLGDLSVRWMPVH